MKTQRIKVVNPLVVKFSGRFGVLCCWSQFVEKWESAETPQEWESLLHQGYNLSFEQLRHGETKFSPVDRTIFYLSCADDDNLYIEGEDHLHRYHPVSQDGKVVELTNYQMKVRLVEKAMSMICQNEFKPWVAKCFDWYQPDFHMKYFTSADLLPTLMYFFGGIDGERGFAHRNFRVPQSWWKHSHVNEQTFEFVMKLITIILSWSKGAFRRNNSWYCAGDEAKELEYEKFVAENVARLDVAKAWATEMLVNMNKIDVLEGFERIDDIVLSTLRKIELRTVVKTGDKERFVKNHEEACAMNSDAAWFLDRYLRTHPKEVPEKRPKKKIQHRRRALASR